jgi:hypothetical protein
LTDKRRETIVNRLHNGVDEMLDLAKAFDNNDDDHQSLVDLSDRPVPKNVRAILDSGIELQCELSYDGRQPPPKQNIRRYRVKAEINWLKHWIKTLVIGEYPADVALIIDLPESVTDDVRQYMMRMQTIVEKRV